MKWFGNRDLKRRVQLVMICLLLVLSSTTVVAANESETSKRTDYAQAGELLIWLEQLDSGLKKLIVQHQATGKIIEVTDGSSAVDAPYTNGEWVVWADKASEPLSSLNWEIHGYHVPTGTKKKLSREAGNYGNPTVDQYGVVWYKRSTYGEMMYRDLQSDLEFSLGEGRFPVLVDRNLVYKNARDGGLSMVNLQTGVKSNLVTLGSTYYIDWFVFNGNHVLARQSDGAGSSQYIAINATAAKVETAELTELSSDEHIYDAMFISDQYALYVQLTDDKPTLHSVELQTLTHHKSAVVPENTQLIGIQGDSILLASSNGTVSDVSIEELEEIEDSDDKGNTPSPVTPNPTSPTPNLPQEDVAELSSYIDVAGGMIESQDRTLQLHFAKDTFQSAAIVMITKKQQDGKAYDELGRELHLASGVWEIAMNAAPAKPVSLTINVNDRKLWESSSEKLAIYYWNEQQQQWHYIRSISKEGTTTLQTTIEQQGRYAVMHLQLTFNDISGHWSQHAVETLASHHIIHGLSAKSYAPQKTLTRAEFAKLLLSALEIEPHATAKPTFTDVKESDWYYGWVEAAAQAGIVQGDHGQFKPHDPLTREQMMTMLMRALDGRVQIDTSMNTQEILMQYEDHDNISSWASSHIAFAVQLELVEGANGRMEPQGLTNRAQAAIVIYRLCKQLNTI